MLNRQINSGAAEKKGRCRGLTHLFVMGFFVLLTFGFFILRTGAVSVEAAGERPGETKQALETKAVTYFGENDGQQSQYNGSGNFLPLKVGFVPLQGFFMPHGSDASLFDGYAYTIIQSLAANNGWDVTYIPGTWEENIARLRSGEIDFFPEAPGRCIDYPDIAGTDYGIATVTGKIVLSSEAVQNETGRLITANSNTGSAVSKLSWSEKSREYTTLDEMREAANILSGRSYSLGYVASIYPGRRVPDAALSGGINWQLREFPDMESMERAFHEGRLDAYLDNSVRTNENKGQNAYHFDSYECRLLVRKDRKNLLDIVNAAVIRLYAVNNNIKRDNAQIYYEDRGSFVRPAYTAAELKFLKEHPVLRASAMTDQEPFSYMDGTDYKGVLADLLKIMADDMGVTIEMVPARGPEDTVDNISSGKADFVADLNTDITWARRLRMNITAPYMNVFYAQVARKGSKIPENPLVAAPRFHFFTQRFVEPRHRGGNVVYFDNVESTIDAVSNGHADIAYIKGVTAFRTLAQDNHHNLYIRQMNTFAYPVSFGVWENEDPMLFRVLNKAVCRLAPGTAYQLAANYMTEDLEATTGYRETLLDRKGVMSFLAFILIITGIMGVCAYRYYREREYLRVDPLTGYHNRRWLEEVMPGEYRESLEEPFREEQLYVLTIGMARVRSILEMAGRQTIAGKLKEILDVILSDNKWAVLGVTSTAVGQIFVICRFDNRDIIVPEVLDIIRAHDSLEIAHGVVHPELKAGVAPVNGAVSFREAISEAIIKATAAYNTVFSGNEMVSFYDSHYNRQMNLQTKIEAVMEKALEKKEFLVFYQPKYELKTGRIIGAESLVRWQSEELGFLNPGSFIDLFERNGFVVWLDHYMLDRVMAYQRRRINLGLPLVPISVNQSRHHLTEPGYLEKMEKMAKKYQLPAGAIELELTETVFCAFDQMKYQQNAVNTFRKLRELGFVFSIDDFGSGYSSFRLLAMLPFHAIKIDKSLLVAAETNSQMQLVLAGIVDMGEKLEMTVICEGVETVGQERMLIELGCKYGQGYLNARPMPEDEFDELMKRKNRAGTARG
ncbi:MAG: EAL domain-containing protein [Selenomonadaceae bacterium]|nr:EAL domain-containing protein [Selenomonadaceae bacterium]